MSSLLVESPVSNSQLYFTWIEDLQCDDLVGEETSALQSPPLDRTMPLAETTESCQPLAGNDAHSAQSRNGPGAEDSLSHEPCLKFTDGHLDIAYDDGSPRIAKPVRIGGVMIQLLRRYGITDQEINEGIARYALKHRQQAAS